jgi:hypothetical protein
MILQTETEKARLTGNEPNPKQAEHHEAGSPCLMIGDLGLSLAALKTGVRHSQDDGVVSFRRNGAEWPPEQAQLGHDLLGEAQFDEIAMHLTFAI